MNSSDLTSLIWLQQDDILKHMNTTQTTVATSSGLGPKHFINVITSGPGGMAKPSILMFKPTSGNHHRLTTELTQLVASPGPTSYMSHTGGGCHQVEEVKYIEMKDYNEDSCQSSSTGSSTLQSINTQLSPHHHSVSSSGNPYSPPTPTKPSPPPSISGSSCSSPSGGGASSSGNTSVASSAGGSEYRKPPFSYSQLVFMSIENSQEKALPLREIYSWIEKYFPYYKNAPTGWKNSIRHELSYKNYFKKVTTTTKFIKGAWSVDKVYRPKLYTKLKSFLNHDDKLTHNLNKCLCETVSKYDLFSFINNNNDDEISAASIIMELKNNPATPGTKGDTSRLEREASFTPTKAAKQTKRKHSEKQQYGKNNNSLLVSNLNRPVTVVTEYGDCGEAARSGGLLSVYEISPHKRIKVEHHGELEGEEPVVNLKIEDPSPDEYGGYDDRMDVKEETCVEYDGTVVASEVIYAQDVVKYETDEPVRSDQRGARSDPCGDVIRDPFSEIQDSYVEECGEEEEEEKRKRDGAACALLHLAGFSSSLENQSTRSNTPAKSRNVSKPAGRRKLKVLKSTYAAGGSNPGLPTVSHSGSSSIKKNNSWTLLTYPELFACSASTVKTGDIER